MLAAASRKLNMSDYDEWKYRTDRDATIMAIPKPHSSPR